MQGRNRATLPGSTSNGLNSIISWPDGQRKSGALTSGTKYRAGLRRPAGPGQLPSLSSFRALNSASDSTSPLSSSSGPATRKDVETSSYGSSHAANRAARPAYKLSDDPLLRQSQILLEASRLLREQSIPPTSVDQRPGCSSASYYGSQSQSDASVHPSSSSLPSQQPAVLDSPSSPSRPSCDPLASFGSLATATATAAARLTVASARASAATAATAGPRAMAATAAVTAGGAAVAPGAAQASSVAASAALTAMSAASSGWLAIEELLEEAAYSLSQELPGGRAISPLDTLLATSSASTSASSSASPAALVAAASFPAGDLSSLSGTSVLPAALSAAGGGGAGGLLGPGVATPASFSAPWPGSLPYGSGVLSAVPGGDRLSEMLDDLLYSLSQDLSLESTGEAVASASAAAAAGLAGAAVELPRAAVAVYRSAAEAASAAAAARMAARGHVGSSSGYTLPEGVLPEPPSDPAWDPFGTIRAAELGVSPDSIQVAQANLEAAAPAESLAADAGAVAAAATAATSTAVASAAVPPPPVVVATAAPSIADAATATAESVVGVATTAAAGTVVIPAPPVIVPPVASMALPPPVPVPMPPPAPAAAATAVITTPPAPAPPPTCAPLTAPPAATTMPPAVVPVPSNSGAESTLPAAPAAPIPPPAVAAAPAPEAPPPAPPAAVEPAGVVVYDDVYGGNDVDVFDTYEGQLDELTAALQSLLAVQDAAADGAVDALDAAAAASSSAAGALPPAAEAAVTTLSEALRRELGSVVGAADVADADPTALAQAAGQAVSSALSTMDLTSLPPDLRLTTLLGATLQSSLDMVESALGGVRTADSTLVGGITIAAVLAVLLRAVVSMAGSAINRGRDAGLVAAAAGQADGGAAAGSGSRSRVVGACALDAAAALNNDPLALLVDIRNGSDVQEQGLPDLRPFRRGAGASVTSLPYCDFRTAPTLANPSGLLSAPAAAAAPAKASPTAAAAGPTAVTVSVDPKFVSRFKKLAGLGRDSRVFLLDSYGVEAPEAVALLRSDPELERLLGYQIKFVEGGFAGPEGWKLTGLPVADPPAPEASAGPSAASSPTARGLDLTGLLSGMAGLRLRYPFLFSRGLAVGAAGAGGLAVASSLDWGAVSRGAVGLAAAMLLADRALPSGMRPSGKIRKYLEAQLAEPQSGDANSDDAASRRRRTALLLRALDLAETVGDAVVRAGGAALAAAGSAARNAMAGSGSTAAVPAALAPPDAAAAPAYDAESEAAGVTGAGGHMAAAAVDVDAQLETPPLAPAPGGAATIVLPLGMDSLQWSAATEEAAAAQKSRSPSPLRANGPLSGAQPAATTEAAEQLLPPPPPSPSLAGRLGTVLRTAADAVVRAASPARSNSGAGGLAAAGPPPAPRAPSPGTSGGSKGPDTMELMAALATASALSSTNLSTGDGLLPAGWPAVNFPRASAGQGPSSAGQGPSSAGQGPSSAGQGPSSAGQGPSPPGGEQTPASGAEDAADEAPSVAKDWKGWRQGQEEEATTPTASPWANWRQELDVAPQPPAIDDIRSPGPARWRLQQVDAHTEQDSSGVDRTATSEADGEGSEGGSASIAASRLGLSPRRRFRGDDAGDGVLVPLGGEGDSSHGRRQQQPDGAASAAMQMMRMDLASRDDDGLGVGIYGGGRFFGGSSGDEGSDVEGEAEGAVPELAAVGAGVAAARGARGGRAGSAGVATARMARQGGLSPGRQRQQGAGAKVPRRQPLRTASPERAAAAAAAMRQLRLEMGLPPNDGQDWAGAPATATAAASKPVAAAAVAQPIAVTPRDWRRELEAAAEAEAEAEAAEALVVPAAGGGSISGRAARQAGGAPVSRLPRNWRGELEGGASVPAPADWRARLEGDGSSGGGGGNGAARRSSSSSPGRTKLTPAERAARDARLQDWRARV